MFYIMLLDPVNAGKPNETIDGGFDVQNNKVNNCPFHSIAILSFWKYYST